jgi:wyosine [tRNA(Phe)-imidazoG37] synthetase (radical SAM superfamily)
LKYIFGPVASRRLKRSLGIDLIPYKTCSFDCIYCELGRTTNKTIERKEYIPPKKIISDLKEYLAQTTVIPDYITLGGSGEPTLHSRIGVIISEIKKITSIPVAVLTNSSLLYQNAVKEALLGADVILPSLDAVTRLFFEYLNRPHPSLQINEIINGLKDFRKAFAGEIWLEIVFCLGVNDSKKEIEALKEAIQEINPDKIQLNSVDRPPAEDYVFSTPIEKLAEIQKKFGEKAEIIAGQIFDSPTGTILDGNIRILNLLKRRPCTLIDIFKALGIHQNELVKLLDILRKEEKIHYRMYNNQCYYQAS